MKSVRIKLAFCPTGLGGGVDPSCSKDGQTGNTRASELTAQAKAASAKAINSKSSADHEEAAKAHTTASKVHAENGNALHTGIHKSSAKEHTRLAKIWHGVEKLRGAAVGVAGLAKGAGGSGGGRSGGGRAGGGGGGAGVKKKKKLKLSFCSTGEGGGVDPSCSPKFGGDAMKRMMLASQASGKAKAETNVLRAASLHGKAAAANQRAAKAIEKDPQYGKIQGAMQIRDLHDTKAREHAAEMKQISDKIFNKNPERVKEIQAERAKVSREAEQASFKANLFDKRNTPQGGRGVRFYGAGYATPEVKAIRAAQSYGLHNKAAAAFDKAGNSIKADQHRASAAFQEKRWEEYRSMMGER